MTFINGIRKLIKAEGYNLDEYEEDAKTMNDNLVYVVRFCKSSGVRLNHDTRKDGISHEEKMFTHYGGIAFNTASYWDCSFECFCMGNTRPGLFFRFR